MNSDQQFADSLLPRQDNNQVVSDTNTTPQIWCISGFWSFMIDIKLGTWIWTANLLLKSNFKLGGHQPVTEA